MIPEVDSLEDLMNDEPPTCNCWYVRGAELCGKEAHWKIHTSCGCRWAGDLSCHEHKAKTDKLSRNPRAECRMCGTSRPEIWWTPI